MLMNHLDENKNNHAKIKSSIVDVLSETVLIAAGGSIGQHTTSLRLNSQSSYCTRTLGCLI